MTYIIGIKKYGITSVISDTQVSAVVQGKIVGKVNYTLKTGFLFKGCMYGASGDPESIYSFLCFLKNREAEYEYEHLNDRRIAWLMLKTAVEVFPFADFHPFQMIISSYHSGKPTLYLLDFAGSEKLKEVREDIITIGDGKEILDERLKAFHRNYADTYLRAISKDKSMRHCYPYIYTSWLMARVQGHDYNKLAERGVGGYFHFLIQTEKGSTCQAPAVYILYNIFPLYNHMQWDENDKGYLPIEITPSVYRIGYVREGTVLMIDSHPTLNENFDRHTVFNLWSQEHVTEELGFPSEENDLAREAIHGEWLEQKLYCFCGFVYADPRYEVFIEGFICGDDGKHASVIDRVNNRWIISEERKKHVENYLTESFNKARSNPDKLEVKVFHPA